MHSVYTLAIIGLATSAIALPVWEAQTCDSDVTDYYYYGYKEKRGGKEAIDYYYTDDGQKRDHIRDNDKRHEARSPHCLRLEEID